MNFPLIFFPPNGFLCFDKRELQRTAFCRLLIEEKSSASQSSSFIHHPNPRFRADAALLFAARQSQSQHLSILLSFLLSSFPFLSLSSPNTSSASTCFTSRIFDIKYLKINLDVFRSRTFNVCHVSGIRPMSKEHCLSKKLGYLSPHIQHQLRHLSIPFCQTRKRCPHGRNQNGCCECANTTLAAHSNLPSLPGESKLGNTNHDVCCDDPQPSLSLALSFFLFHVNINHKFWLW